MHRIEAQLDGCTEEMISISGVRDGAPLFVRGGAPYITMLDARNVASTERTWRRVGPGGI